MRLAPRPHPSRLGASRRAPQDDGAKSRTPRGAAASVAFHAGAVAHQREIAAFAAGFAFVTLGLGLGALFRRRGAGLLLRPGERIGRAPQALLGLDFERGAAASRPRDRARS